MLRPKAGIARLQSLEVSRDELSGGVKIKIGDRACVLSPQEAVRFASGILSSAGVDVQFINRAQVVAHPPINGLSS